MHCVVCVCLGVLVFEYILTHNEKRIFVTAVISDNNIRQLVGLLKQEHEYQSQDKLHIIV
jgi:hypothetical protein